MYHSCFPVKCEGDYTPAQKQTQTLTRGERRQIGPTQFWSPHLLYLSNSISISRLFFMLARIGAIKYIIQKLWGADAYAEDLILIVFKSLWYPVPTFKSLKKEKCTHNMTFNLFSLANKSILERWRRSFEIYHREYSFTCHYLLIYSLDEPFSLSVVSVPLDTGTVDNIIQWITLQLWLLMGHDTNVERVSLYEH